MGVDTENQQGITGEASEKLKEKRRKAAERQRRSRAGRKEKALQQESDWGETHKREMFPAGRYFIPIAYRCTRRKGHEGECVIELTNYIRVHSCYEYFSQDGPNSPEGFRWRDEILEPEGTQEPGGKQ